MVIFEHSVATWIIWLGVAAGSAVVLFSFWRFLALDWVAGVLGALRLLFIVGLAWCLFQPEYRRSLTQLLKPRFVVALDTSRSMELSPAEEVSNRWNRAAQILNQPWTSVVNAECDLDVYPFASDVGGRLALEDLATLAPAGPTTLLRDALVRLSERYKGQNVAGFLLLSDGLDTREAFDDWAAGPWPWPIYTVRLEPETAWEIEPDIRIDTVSTPRRVNVGWNTKLKAVVSGQGTQGRAVNVQLFKDNVLLKEIPTQIPTEGGARDVSFELEHPDIGVFTYSVFVAPFPGESHTNDNQYAVSVQVIDARNRVLYVEGTPRWESKYLSRALKASERVTPLTFIRGPGGRFLTLGTRGSMTTDMTPSQLSFFKIVILGNLSAEELGAERAANLVDFVDSGGSLVLLGGSRGWGPEGFATTPLRKVIPVKAHGGQPVEEKVPTVLTDAGRAHPAFAGDPELWDIVPPILSYFPDVAISAGAETLVGVNTSGGVQPIIVAQRYGQGKVVALFTDSLWKWKLSPGTREAKPYQRFWNQLLSWLTPAEEELAPERIDLFADKEQVFLGEEIELNARTGTSDGETPPAIENVRCVVTSPDERRVPFAMTSRHVVTPSGKSFPGYATEYTAQLPGLHKAMVTADINGEEIESDPISFFVKPFTPESVPRPSNTDVLRTLAQSSGGRFFRSITDLDAALASLQFASLEEERVKYLSLWRNFIMLTCLMGLLTLEWAVRKWRNMP